MFGLVGNAHGAAAIHFGAYAPPAPGHGMAAATDLETAVGQPLDIVHFYQAWGGYWADVQPEWLDAASAGGSRRVLLSWEPWTPPGPARQPAFALEQIAGGAHDEYIRRFARGLAAWGGRVYLRPMHEVNGDWYPWAGGLAENSAELYVRAWRRMHRIFAAEGARNVVWVWSPGADDVPAGNRFEAYYPGREHVDVLALDGYNWGADGYGGWRTFDQVFRDPYRRIARLGPQPIWLAEVGSAADGGDKAAWVRQMFRSARSPRYSRLTAIVWFHTLKERDWRATSSPGVTEAFRVELAPRRFAARAGADRARAGGTAAAMVRVALAWTRRIRRLPALLAGDPPPDRPDRAI